MAAQTSGPVELLKRIARLERAFALVAENQMELDCRFVKYWRTEHAWCIAVVTGKGTLREGTAKNPVYTDVYHLVAIDNTWSGGTAEISDCKQFVFNPLVEANGDPQYRARMWEPLFLNLEEIAEKIEDMKPKELELADANGVAPAAA